PGSGRCARTSNRRSAPHSGQRPRTSSGPQASTVMVAVHFGQVTDTTVAKGLDMVPMSRPTSPPVNGHRVVSGGELKTVGAPNWTSAATRRCASAPRRRASARWISGELARAFLTASFNQRRNLRCSLDTQAYYTESGLTPRGARQLRLRAVVLQAARLRR